VNLYPLFNYYYIKYYIIINGYFRIIFRFLRLIKLESALNEKILLILLYLIIKY
jgi:hypothetical protein